MDLRLFGMVVALAVILAVFHILSGGKLVQPSNMVTLSVQATGVAILATGMVLVIVSRNIDLSVGSLVGFVAMAYALLMTDICRGSSAWAPTSRSGGPSRSRSASVSGSGFGALQGFIIAYIGVPSFVVTLGGLLSIRGLVWYLSNGAAVTGLDPLPALRRRALAPWAATLTWRWAIGCAGLIGILVTAAGSGGATASPCGRSGPRLLGVVGCAAILGSARSPTTTSCPQRAWPTSTRRPWHHGAAGGLQIPSACPTRSSC